VKIVLAVALALAVARAPIDPKQGAEKGVVTPEGLGEMLRDLGREPKEMGTDKNRYQILIDRDDWKVFVRVSLSGNRKYVWLDASTQALADPDAAPPGAWLRLLHLNDEIFPARFTYDKKAKQIRLLMPMENRGITPARLRQEIDAFDQLFRRTEPDWNPKRFAPKG
jgi:hypothetical protein